MAGDWNAIDHELPERPPVVRAMSLFGLEAGTVVGRLVMLWAWADRMTLDGLLRGVTCADFAPKCGGDCAFWKVFVDAGWLIETPEGVLIADFDLRFGDSARRRMKESVRKKRYNSNGGKRDKSKKHPPTQSIPPAPDLRRDCADNAHQQSQSYTNTITHSGDESAGGPAATAVSQTEVDRLMGMVEDREFVARFLAVYPRPCAPRAAEKELLATVAHLVVTRSIPDAQAKEFLIERAMRYRDSPAGRPPASGTDYRFYPAKWLSEGHYDDPDSELNLPNSRPAKSSGSRRSAVALVEHDSGTAGGGGRSRTAAGGQTRSHAGATSSSDDDIDIADLIRASSELTARMEAGSTVALSTAGSS